MRRNKRMWKAYPPNKRPRRYYGGVASLFYSLYFDASCGWFEDGGKAEVHSVEEAGGNVNRYLKILKYVIDDSLKEKIHSLIKLGMLERAKYNGQSTVIREIGGLVSYCKDMFDCCKVIFFNKE